MADELGDHAAEIESLKVNVVGLHERVHYLEELIDTYLHSPVWKRIWFWAAGWPADRIASQPTPRWWTRFWRWWRR